ncbi:hypothetical protein AB0C28_52165 [Nonomuraea sp. NPDC048892]|uniref:hypothetical protein n=1 Tax=Nonomuraea sp. NPDC048892 TaxID=3154624 RepID=UPI00340F67FF
MLDHYRALFKRHQWLTDGACWTVVQPFDDEMTPDDLLWRMNGGRDPEELTVDHPMELALNEDLTLLFVFEGDGGYGFLECTYGDPPSDELLRTLDREDFDGRRATALAFIEAATGVGIEIDWLDGEQTTVTVLDNPVS